MPDEVLEGYNGSPFDPAWESALDDPLHPLHHLSRAALVGQQAPGKLQQFNSGASISFPSNPNATGPLYGGALLANGTPLRLPPGWTAQRTALGRYVITHNLGLVPEMYAPVAAARGATADGSAVISDITSTSFTVTTRTISSPSPVDRDFSFICLVGTP